MKRTIKPLKPNYLLRIPNKVNADPALSDLKPLTLQVFLFMVNRWAQRQKELKGTLPANRVRATRVFKVSWHELYSTVRQGTARGALSDYRQLRLAAKELSRMQAEQTGTRMTIINAFQRVEAYGEDAASVLTFLVSEDFEEAWKILEAQGYALVPLVEAFALQVTRHIRMLMLLCEVRNRTAITHRTFTVEELRLRFRLTAKRYEEPWRVVAKVKEMLQAVVVKLPQYKKVRMQVVANSRDARRVEALHFTLPTPKPKELTKTTEPVETKPLRGLGYKPRIIKRSFEEQQLADAIRQEEERAAQSRHAPTTRPKRREPAGGSCEHE